MINVVIMIIMMITIVMIVIILNSNRILPLRTTRLRTARNVPESASSELTRSVVWSRVPVFVSGFDCDFTNHNFKRTLNFKQMLIVAHLAIYFLQTKSRTFLKL